MLGVIPRLYNGLYDTPGPLLAAPSARTPHVWKAPAFDPHIPVQKTRKSSGTYVAYIRAPGINYQVGDTFVVDGTKLDGATSTNDATIEVATVNGDGAILTVTVTGSSPLPLLMRMLQ